MTTEYPTAPASVAFSRQFADIFAAASEGDQRRMTNSHERGYGYLSDDFDSAAASNASAALCHFHRAEAAGRDDEPNQAVIAYHVDLASRFAARALA